MFVRSGTFSSDGTNLVLVAPQKYGEGSNTLPVHLVFNADAGVIRHFEDYNLKTAIPQMSTRILAQIKAAESQGVKVIGVQLDFDVATRLLPKYAEIIKGIRRTDSKFQGKSFFFTITGLMSWLGTRGLDEVAHEVDFMVPQAYEGETGLTVDEMKPVFDPDLLARQIPKAERLSCPYWIGIPAYGHAFLFDEKDRLLGTYRNLEAQDALRHPSFKLVSAYASDRNGKVAQSTDQWVGEEILKFKAVRPSPTGEGLGYTLAYSLPSPDLILRSFQSVNERRGSNCQGVILYRMPETGSSFSVPLTASEHALKSKPIESDLSVRLTTSQDTAVAIEGSRKDIPKDLFVEVENIGLAPTFVGPDALDIQLIFEQTGFEGLRLRDFDQATFTWVSSDKTEKEVLPGRANSIHLKKGFLYPGQKVYAGPIRLLNPGKPRVRIKWRVRSFSGFSFSEKEVPMQVVGN